MSLPLSSSRIRCGVFILALLQFLTGTPAFAHGDVDHASVNLATLERYPGEDRKVNPYRDASPEQYDLAQKVGASAYNQNCARCHGLNANSASGTVTQVDLRASPRGDSGDADFIDRVRNGHPDDATTNAEIGDTDDSDSGRGTQDGHDAVEPTPTFEATLPQEAIWAIRSYTENQPRD